jgi:hypothetical protein
MSFHKAVSDEFEGSLFSLKEQWQKVREVAAPDWP